MVKVPECEFLALAELRPELGRQVQSKYNIPRLYRDHRELADDSEIEAVGVSGPYSSQGEIAKELLLAGKHVFLEKPLAVSVKQTEDILTAVKKSGKK